MNVYLNKIKELEKKYLYEGSISSRFVKGAFWSFLGTIIFRGLNLISLIIVARFLGKVGFGEFGMIQSTVGMLSVFSGLGLGITATKYIAEFREKDRSKTSRIIALSQQVAFITGGVTAFILIIIAPWLSSNILSAPNLEAPLRIASGLLFLGAINGTQTGILAGFEAFKRIAIINFCAGFFSLPVVVLGVKLWGLNGAITGLVISRAFNWLLNHYSLLKEYNKNKVIVDFNNSLEEFPVLWKFSIPAFLSGAMVGPVTWLCNTILVNQPNGYAELGIFIAANQWKNFLVLIPGIFSMPTITIMSDSIGKNKISDMKKFYLKVTFFNGILLLLSVIIISLSSSWIMKAYGNEFIHGREVLIILMIVALLIGILTPSGNLIVSSGKMWLGFFMNLGWAIAIILFTFIFVKLGALGLSLAYLISYMLHALWVFVFVYYYFHAHVN